VREEDIRAHCDGGLLVEPKHLREGVEAVVRDQAVYDGEAALVERAANAFGGRVQMHVVVIGAGDRSSFQ
jgi:hypothetical protein